MKKLLLGITALALMAGVAFGADVPVKAQNQIVAASAPLTWTGPWGGVVLGYGWKNEDLAVAGNDSKSKYILSSGAFPSSIGLRPDGGILGVRLGYDYQIPQMQRVVVGVVGGYSYSGIRGTASAGGNLVGVQFDERIKDIWDIFGRVGYLVTDKSMLYVIGGFTGATVNTNITSAGLICGSGYCPFGSSSGIKWGGSVGGGIEYRLDRIWSLNTEYLWTDLGTRDTIVTMSCGYKCSTSFTNSEAVKINRLLVGLNARF